jgi:hypothetical protein
LEENQTDLAKLQWKNKWESFSSMLHVSQFLLILVDRFPALAPVAIAFRINLQAKVFMLGDRSLLVHTLLKISMDWAVTPLEPCVRSCTCIWELRSLKASFYVHLPWGAGLHLIASCSAGYCDDFANCICSCSIKNLRYEISVPNICSRCPHIRNVLGQIGKGNR